MDSRADRVTAKRSSQLDRAQLSAALDRYFGDATGLVRTCLERRASEAPAVSDSPLAGAVARARGARGAARATPRRPAHAHIGAYGDAGVCIVRIPLRCVLFASWDAVQAGAKGKAGGKALTGRAAARIMHGLQSPAFPWKAPRAENYNLAQ